MFDHYATPFWRLAGCCLLACILFVSGACARQEPPTVKPLRTTILIMDFDVPQEYVQDKEMMKRGGWWFGAYRLYRNPNAGKQFADLLTIEMRSRFGDWMSLYDRLRLRQHFAKKRTLLASEYLALDENEIDVLMKRVPPTAFAKEMGADKVLVGHIDSTMNVNSASRFWRSKASVEAKLIDTDSGKVLWQYQDDEAKSLKSEAAVQETLARRFAEAMQEEYFYRPQQAR